MSDCSKFEVLLKENESIKPKKAVLNRTITLFPPYRVNQDFSVNVL